MSVMGAAPLSQSTLASVFSARSRRISCSSASRLAFSRWACSRREEVEFVRKERSLPAIIVCYVLDYAVVECCSVG